MGIVRANIKLSNPRDVSLRPLEVVALVDTGAMTLCLPEHIALQLGLQEFEKREVTTADDRRMLVPYVGPVQVQFENRTCFTGALVLSDMDLVVDPQKVTVNPESPNIPSALVMGVGWHR